VIHSVRLACLLLTVPALGQSLVRDINQTPPTLADHESWPGHFRTIGTTTFFAATSPSGRELWKTDGTPAGTVRVRDINPAMRSDGSAESSDPHSLLVWNGTLYFVAFHPEFEWDIWKSDGSLEGTVPVHDYPGRPQNLTIAGGRLFSTTDGQGHLWTSDGTSAGTRQLSVFELPPHDLVDVNGKLLFAARTAAAGWELWSSDGTVAGTTLVKDIQPGAASSDPQRLSVFAGMLYFEADAGSGRELWLSDGTTAGTQPAASIRPGYVGAQPGTFHTVGSRTLFAKYDTAHGVELWQGDGTLAGTSLVMDVRPGPESAVSRFMVVYANQLIFMAFTDSLGGELWRSDGTPAGTQLLKDIVPGPRGSIWEPGFAVMNGILYFPASSGLGETVWRTDGTTAGTVQVSSALRLDPQEQTDGRYFGVCNGTLLFQASVFQGNILHELCRSDGTAAGSGLLVQVNPPGITISSQATPYFGLGGRAYLYANDGGSGDGLWSSDGTAAGTRHVMPGAPILHNVHAFGGGYLFGMDRPVGSLWRVDGAGSFQQLLPGTVVRDFVTINGMVLFGGGPTLTNVEIWTTDGTPTGTRLWLDVNPSPNASGLLSGFAHLGGWYYFSGNNGTAGPELWRTDGTLAGTAMFADLRPGSIGSGPTMPCTVANRVLFSAVSASEGRELWRTDGTVAGTVLVKDVNPGTASSALAILVPGNGVAFFLANDGVHGVEPWRSDGTAAGTYLLADVRAGSAGSGITGLVVAGDLCWFAADDGQHGVELWASDGTTNATRMVRDIWPDHRSSNPAAITVAGNGSRIVFAATDPLHGSEPWTSDGTAAGTYRLGDVAPDELGSMPANFLRVGSTWYFTANDVQHGRELWTMPHSLTARAGTVGYGEPCAPQSQPWPRIGAFGRPIVGNEGFALLLRDASPSALAIACSSSSRADLALPGGCRLLVCGPSVSAPFGADAGGSVRVPLPVPWAPELVGVDVYFQFVVCTIDGLAFSGGLQATVGF
jgi:ELWxxDGT repeat protein